MSQTVTTTPITKTVEVACDVGTAFRVFTTEIGSWWPTTTHAVHAGAVRDVVWEEREGGKVIEIAATGERSTWATVLTWEPPYRLVIAWQVNPERVGTEVEVRFAPEAGGTRVDLEHRGWERIAAADEMRAGYETGWDPVLAEFVAAVGGA
jgi:Activator of Hsp90 ATPase homolog 1-like protein